MKRSPLSTNCFITVVFLFLSIKMVLGQTSTTIKITEDAHVYSASSSSNYANATTIPIWTVNSTSFYRYYLKADLTSIPYGSHIVSAKIRLKPISEAGIVGSPSSTQFNLRGLATSWSESSITYANSNPPSTTGSAVTSSLNPTIGNPWREFDVTNLIQSMLSGSILNNGFVITRNPETTANSSCTYTSGEDATSANRPEIVISYYAPIGVTSATITHATSATSNNGTITPTFSGGSGSYSYKWYDLSTSTGYSTALSGQTSLSISSRLPGCYGLEIKDVTLNKFYYMAFIVGVVCDPINLTFYPGTNFMDDALVSAASPNGTGVSVTEIQASGNTGTDMRTFIRFRIWFETGITPVYSELYLAGKSHDNPGGANTNDAEFQRVDALKFWDELTVNYITQPSFSNAIVVNVPPSTSASMSKSYNITSFCDYWKQNNTNNNFGMVFKLDNFTSSSARQQYHSSDATAASDKPYVKFIVDQPVCDRTSYTMFKRELDASYVSTYQGKIKIQFTEEYEQVAGKKVPLNLYDENRTLVASIKYDGTAIAGSALLPALVYQFDDNQFQLNLSTYSLVVGKYYILELTKNTGEKEYIQFVYVN
ncbi:MAG: SprB repeat-containing protein [Flavobacteriia bacterium]|nr:SprB repeat-containing protein [Flavobacteriia bacterium]